MFVYFYGFVEIVCDHYNTNKWYIWIFWIKFEYYQIIFSKNFGIKLKKKLISKKVINLQNLNTPYLVYRYLLSGQSKFPMPALICISNGCQFVRINWPKSQNAKKYHNMVVDKNKHIPKLKLVCGDPTTIVPFYFETPKISASVES